MTSALVATQLEVRQDHSLRKPLIQKLQDLRDSRLVLSFFISFRSRSPLGFEDANIIEEVLVNSDTSKGVTLLLDAPGGDGLAAERIIQLCRKYSQHDFETIIPSRAKSAATMICLGSDRILMGPTSELGPIDPQIPLKFGETWQWVAAHHVVKTYDDLMKNAIELQQGHIEPYLQQLAQFNATHVQMLRASTELAANIAVSSLKRGMLKEFNEREINKRIKCFTDPDVTLSHGRALTTEHLAECGLNIKELDLQSELWKVARDLYVRSTFVVDRAETGGKLLETVNFSYQGG